MECQNRGSRRAPPRSSSSTRNHTPIGAFKCAVALSTRANTCVVARNLINALHNANGRGKEHFPPRGACWGARPIAMRGEGRYCVLNTERQPALVCTKDGAGFNPVECLPFLAECSCHFNRFPPKEWRGGSAAILNHARALPQRDGR